MNNIENYFFDSSKPSNIGKKLVLVIYDITCTKRRTKFVKFLESYGVRVQKSAFEMILNNSQYTELIKKIPVFIDDTDNVRVYKLKIYGEVTTWGSDLTENEEIIII